MSTRYHFDGAEIDKLLPDACHVTERYANKWIEADHGRLKAGLRSMRGLKRIRSAVIIAAGHAFVQNLRRGHYELGVDVPPGIESRPHSPSSPP